MDRPGRDCQEEKTITVRNGMFETKLRTDGSGAPLLFLHGAGGLRGWDTFLVELAKDFTVYAPAHPGFETSTGLEHIDDMLDMVLSPHRVRKLVLVNAVGLWLDDHPIADFFAMTPEQLAVALWHDPQSDVARVMMAVPQDEKAQLEAYLIRMQHLSAAGKFLWPIPDKGLKKRIHRIQAPTLILWGQSDGLAPVVYAQAFQERIPGSRVTIMPRCGHMPMYEDPAGFVRAVTRFLKN